MIKFYRVSNKNFINNFVKLFVPVLVILGAVIFVTNASAANASNSKHYIVGLDYATGRVLDTDNTDQVDGVRATFAYSQENFWWHNLQLLFEGSAAYYNSTYGPLEENYSDELWVFAVAPVFRYHFLPEHQVDLYADISAGPGYLSNTRFESRNLGIHYTFQDMAGIGALFGKEHEYSVSVRIIHYSNGGLSEHNRGFTIPVIAAFSYGF